MLWIAVFQPEDARRDVRRGTMAGFSRFAGMKILTAS